MTDRERVIRLEDDGSVLGTFEKITLKVAEQVDEFIFETLSEWYAYKTQRIVKKTDMIAALANYLQAVPAEMEGGGHEWWYVCGECHGTIRSQDTFCRHCGRRVKWSE